MRPCVLVIQSVLCGLAPPAAAGDLKAVWGDCIATRPPEVQIAHCSELVSTAKNKRVLEHAYNTRGLAYLGFSKYDQAIEDFSKVIKIDPKIAGYFDNRQNALKGAGRLTEALSDADRAVALAPTYSFVFRARGNLLAAMQQFGRAKADYNYSQAVSLSPDDAGLYFDRGEIFLQSGDPDAAAADFTHAIALNGALASAFRERGLIYKSAGLKDRAREDLKTALSLAPGDSAATDGLRELDSSADQGKLPN